MRLGQSPEPLVLRSGRVIRGAAARPQSAAPRDRPAGDLPAGQACSWRSPRGRRSPHGGQPCLLRERAARAAAAAGHQAPGKGGAHPGRRAGQRLLLEHVRAHPGQLDLRRRRAPVRHGACRAREPQRDGRHRLDLYQRVPGQPAADRLPRSRQPGRRGHDRRDRRGWHVYIGRGGGHPAASLTAAGWPPGMPTGWLPRGRGTVRAGDAGLGRRGIRVRRMRRDHHRRRRQAHRPVRACPPAGRRRNRPPSPARGAGSTSESSSRDACLSRLTARSSACRSSLETSPSMAA